MELGNFQIILGLKDFLPEFILSLGDVGIGEMANVNFNVVFVSFLGVVQVILSLLDSKLGILLGDGKIPLSIFESYSLITHPCLSCGKVVLGVRALGLLQVLLGRGEVSLGRLYRGLGLGQVGGGVRLLGILQVLLGRGEVSLGRLYRGLGLGPIGWGVKFLELLQVYLRRAKAGFGSGHRPLKGVRFQLGQHLTLFHYIAQVHFHLTDHPANPEGQPYLMRQVEVAAGADGLDQASSLHFHDLATDRGGLSRTFHLVPDGIATPGQRQYEHHQQCLFPKFHSLPP